ncbi:uncharacterized protein [Venturia canescens]|uniref:uncharacterized protein n=1 Tax=Venturia canescens TaxID=32260 RepID=UPI001C9D2866|nr:uncharacterized protein LOC122416032 [Venturia canescens]
MYRCLKCGAPVALSWISQHECFLQQRKILIDEYGFVDGIQANIDREQGRGVCLETQEKSIEGIWNCVVAAFEHNQDMLRDTAHVLRISRLADSWAELDNELEKYAEGSLEEWKETIKNWETKTVSKWQILEQVLLPTDHQRLDLFFTDAGKRYLHLMNNIKNFAMNVIEIE